MTAIIKVVENRIVVTNDVSAQIAATLLPQVAAAQTAQSLAEGARDLSQQAAADAAMVSGVDTARRASVATAQSQPVAASIQTIVTDAYAPTYADLDTLSGGARYVRASLADLGGYPALAYWRHDTDRYLPDGTTDATNGGYFVLAESVVSPLMLGAKGDGSTDDTAAIAAVILLQRPVDLGGRTYIISGLTPPSSVTEIRLSNGTLKLADGADTTMFQPANESADVEMIGVTFDGNHQGQSGYNQYTVNFSALNTFRAIGCTFVNGSGSVLSLLSVRKSAVIDGCLFMDGLGHTGEDNENTTYVAVRVDTDYETVEGQFVTITGNTFIGLETDDADPELPNVGYGVAGINCPANSAIGDDSISSYKLVISGNVFWNCGTTATDNKVGSITIYRQGSFARITDNIILFGDEKGIDVHTSDHALISGNVVYQTREDGISVATRSDLVVGVPTTRTSANPIITGNTVIGTGVAVTDSTLLYSGIRATGSDTVTGATNISVTDNLVSAYPQALVIASYLGSITVADNIFDSCNSEFTSSNQRPISIVADSADNDIKNARISFTGNQISNMGDLVDNTGGGTYIRGAALPVIISGNTWDTVSTGANALTVLYCSSTVSVTNNVFRNVGVAFRIDNSSGPIMFTGNTVNTAATANPVDFRTNTGPILVTSNLLNNVANNCFNFNTCSSKIYVSENLVLRSGGGVATIGSTSSTVTTGNNILS